MAPKPTVSSSDRLFTINELSDKLRTHANTIRLLCKNGELKAFKIGKAWLVTEASLNDFLARKVRGE